MANIFISDQSKVDILIKLIEENRNQTKWVKNLDFKIVYYTLALYFASLAWFISHPPHCTYLFKIDLFIVIICLLGLLFIIRNHLRHCSLNEELLRLKEALLLFKKDEYIEGSLFTKKKKFDLAFHWGRGLYCVIIVIISIVTIVFINSINTFP